jgi:hypothetical protein
MKPKQPREYACESPCGSGLCAVANALQEVQWAVGVMFKENPDGQFHIATPEEKLAMAKTAMQTSGVNELLVTQGSASMVVRAGTTIDTGKCKNYG